MMQTNPDPEARPASRERFYALDWLRCCAFILLVWVHTAQLFQPGGWHLHLPEIPALDPLVRFCKPWRMPLVFLVSGVALSFSFDRRGSLPFLASSAKRLLPPLLFGVVVLIPPVTYFELREAGGTASLADAYRLQAERVMAGDLTWYILWYLGYLLAFCCAVAVLWAWWRPLMLRSRLWRAPSELSAYLISLALALPLVMVELFLAPTFPVVRNFYSDLASVATFFIVFNYGATVVRNPFFLRVLARFCWASFVLAVLAYAFGRSDGAQQGELHRIAEGLIIWLWLLFFVGLASRYFNREQAWVRAFNRIVFPFYLVHQLAILTVAAGLRDWVGGLPLYFAIGVLASLASAAFTHGVLLQLKPLHRFFGITGR